MRAPAIQRLAEQFLRFPTVGPRTASRFVSYLIHARAQDIDDLLEALQALQRDVALCSFCFQPFQKDASQDLCSLCRDPQRDESILCLVEQEGDIEAVEQTGAYRGRYFVLGGTVGTLTKEERELLRGSALVARLRDTPSVKEIIIATNPTTEGETTALYLRRLLKPFSLRVTRIGKGLPVGGELEYADEETIRSSLQNRQ